MLLGWSAAPIEGEWPVTFRLGDGALYGLRLETRSATEQWLVSLGVESEPDLAQVTLLAGRRG